VPWDRECTEWADCNHFDGGRIAALRYAYNPTRGLYEWVAMGPLFTDARRTLSEASLARAGDGWGIAARAEGVGSRVAWGRTDDPSAGGRSPVAPAEPRSGAPLTVFTCADGVLRLFTGSATLSPRRNERDPLYAWDVSPADFTCANRRVVCDSV